MPEPLDMRPEERPLLAMFERYADAVADDRPFDVIAQTAQGTRSGRPWQVTALRPLGRVAAIVAILIDGCGGGSARAAGCSGCAVGRCRWVA